METNEKLKKDDITLYFVLNAFQVKNKTNVYNCNVIKLENYEKLNK